MEGNEMSKLNYQQLWNGLISALCKEILNFENLPEKAMAIEDTWVKGTLINVLKKMCALHRLPPKMQKENKLTRPLFENQQ